MLYELGLSNASDTRWVTPSNIRLSKTVDSFLDFFLSVSWYLTREASCHDFRDTQAAYGEAHVARKWGLQPGARQEPRPAKNRMSLEVFKQLHSQLTASLHLRKDLKPEPASQGGSVQSITIPAAMHLSITSMSDFRAISIEFNSLSFPLNITKLWTNLKLYLLLVEISALYILLVSRFRQNNSAFWTYLIWGKDGLFQVWI